MTRIVGERLVLQSLTTEVVSARLARDDFVAPVDDLGVVRFGPGYPGDLVVLFPLWLAAVEQPGTIEGTWTIIDLQLREAVGAIGTKGRPDDQGRVEIGYGVAPEHQGRGVATEAVGMLVAALIDRRVDLGAAVRCVTAETRVDNLASQQVLRRNGFVRSGTRTDEHDGELVLWELAGGTPRQARGTQDVG